MPEVKGYESFPQTLANLTVAQQRQIGARFIAHVLDLSTDSRLKSAQEVAAKGDPGAEEPLDAYHAVHALYTRTHPRSDLTEIDYTKQAMHFIAEACLVCLSPTYTETRTHRIAEKAAMYCRMARTCASIRHDVDTPQLGDTEKALRSEIEAQYRLLKEYFGSL